MVVSSPELCAAQRDAVQAAINAGREFTWYHAGFPNPRQSPYTGGY